MTKRYGRTTRYPVAPERLLEILINPDFQVAREKAQGSIEVTVKELSRSDRELRYEVHTIDHVKGITGVDKSRTERNHSVYAWDLAAKRGRWTWHGPHGDRARVWGTLVIRPAGGGASDLEGDFNIEVSVPLVGGKIESIVIKETERGWDRYEAAIRSFI